MPGEAVAGLASVQYQAVVIIENQHKTKTEPDYFLIRFLGLSGAKEPLAWENCARKSFFSFFLRSAQANMESHYNILDRSVL